MKWFEKLIGGTAVEIPQGMPETRTRELSKLHAEIDDTRKGARPGLRRDMLNYVFDGEPCAVLGEVPHIPKLGTRLRLVSGGSGR